MFSKILTLQAVKQVLEWELQSIIVDVEEVVNLIAGTAEPGGGGGLGDFLALPPL